MAKDTINDHTIAGNWVWCSAIIGSRFNEPIVTMTTDEYEGSIPSLVTKQLN